MTESLFKWLGCEASVCVGCGVFVFDETVREFEAVELHRIVFILLFSSSGISI